MIMEIRNDTRNIVGYSDVVMGTADRVAVTTRFFNDTDGVFNPSAE